MKELYKNHNLTITLLNNNYYMIESPFVILKGYYKRLNNNTIEMRLDYWKDGKTNKLKGNTNKLFNHTCNWFVSILEKYLKI